MSIALFFKSQGTHCSLEILSNLGDTSRKLHLAELSKH